MRSDIIAPYRYRQYKDDKDIAAWFEAYAASAQTYLDWFNNTPLPDYTSDQITGQLLDWVASGLYGMVRRPIAYQTDVDIGPLDTFPLNDQPINGGESSASTTYTMTDDIFKRCITWNFYKGDGFVPSLIWLRRRAIRFLTGSSGTAPLIIDYTSVSVVVINDVITFRLSETFDSILVSYFQGAIQSGILNIPVGYSVEVTRIGTQAVLGNFILDVDQLS